MLAMLETPEHDWDLVSFPQHLRISMALEPYAHSYHLPGIYPDSLGTLHEPAQPRGPHVGKLSNAIMALDCASLRVLKSARSRTFRYEAESSHWFCAAG
jgi:hypothetical protein